MPVGRRMTDALYLAPGVSSGGEVGRANPSIGGGSGLENQYVVDGINITNTGYGAIGSYSIVFGSLGSGVTFDFVKEIQVKTGGYEAEFGQSTGGVVNVITKSGANNVHGSLFGYFRPSGLEGEWAGIDLPNLTQIAAQQTASSVNDIGFEVGGPIVRDRLFFFGAYNPQWKTDTFMGLPASPLRALIGETPRDRKIDTYSGKLSSQLGGNHRIDASFFGDPAVGEMGPQRTASLPPLRHQGLQRDRLRRPQPEREVRRHHERQLAARRLVRARAERDHRDAVGQRVAGHRPPGCAEPGDRRPRLLRGQRRHQQAVGGQDHTHLRRPPDPRRLGVRRHQLPAELEPHRPDDHAAQRPAHGDRRPGAGPPGIRRAGRPHLPCHPRQLPGVP